MHKQGWPSDSNEVKSSRGQHCGRRFDGPPPKERLQGGLDSQLEQCGRNDTILRAVERDVLAGRSVREISRANFLTAPIDISISGNGEARVTS
jgi:hypothetical protein